MKKKALSDNGDDNGALIPQPHGGALRTGGKPGNRGGVGQPSALRGLIGQSFRKRYMIAETIADSKRATNKDRLKAVELLHRWAGLDKIGLPDELLREMASDVRAEVDDEAAIGRIFDRWKVTLAAYLARHL